MALSPGTRLGPYEILAVAGSGGMGEVYRARDTRLDRIVAIKVLPEALLQDPEGQQRLEREARAISRLSHPNLCTLHDVGHEKGVNYLVMEYLEGDTLAERLRGGPLPMDQVLRYAKEIAGALETAHQQGIVHRDLKPGNILLTRTGAKLLDFGLARIIKGPPQGQDAAGAPTLTLESETRAGIILGTPAYMSPEQAKGSAVDARTDVFSFGLVLYEMITGQRAFRGDSQAESQAALLRDTPPSVRTVRSGVGAEVERILNRSLEKDPNARFQDAGALLRALQACESPAAAKGGGLRLLGRPGILLPAAVVVLAVLAFSAWTWWRVTRETRARRTVLPEIARFAQADHFFSAFLLARKVEPLLREDPAFETLWRDFSVPTSVRTEPAGAEVLIRDYADPKGEWISLGISPLVRVRVPVGQVRWRLAKDGFETLDLAFPPSQLPSLKLVRRGEGPPGMVRVPAGSSSFGTTGGLEIGEYWMDRFEVTNRQYKEFVDQGGYRKRDYWKQPFVKEGRVLGFDEAMVLFRDTTGRPGPSTWELGDFPVGQADFPVGGVSWYEAAAYAEFAGKSLPTFHHWYRAAGADQIYSGILRLSNFSGAGPARVGSHEGLSPWGAYDMAGNVREWVWNAAGHRRYTLGGAWSDPTYLFTGPDALDPFDRSPMLGFRCALFPSPPPAEVTGSIETVFRDYSKEVPVDDAIFAAYRSLHRYDPGPLDARVESTDASPAYWIEERVSFAAAYGGERIPATLFIPKNSAPPYQAVLYFPPGGALRLDSIRDSGTRQFDFLVRGGRAVFFPSYKGTYERRLREAASGPQTSRDLQIQWSKDVGRSLDYLQNRPDIDGRSLAYYGLSMGAQFGPIAAAVDPRIRAMVLVGGGLNSEEVSPEIDPFNFAPRVHVPTLMINGNHDFIFPVETSQDPLFRLFPLPEGAKRHYIFEGGHVPPHIQEVARETLDWLDRHLGPVRTTAEP